MKKLLLLILLTLGLYPLLYHGKIDVAVTRTMADGWGDEGTGDGDWGGIYDSLSDVLGMDIVGSTEWMGHTVFELGDGSIWDPSSGSLDEVEIHGIMQDIMADFPDIFIPDTPEADPAYYENLDDFFNFIEENTEKPPCPPSVGDLENAFPDASSSALTSLSDIMDSAMGFYGIDTKEKLNHFLAQAEPCGRINFPLQIHQRQIPIIMQMILKNLLS